MSNNQESWNFDKPDDTDPGEHVFALVLYSGSQEVGVRALERAYVRQKWHDHVFAWMPISYPSYTIVDVAEVVDAWRDSMTTRREALTTGEGE